MLVGGSGPSCVIPDCDRHTNSGTHCCEIALYDVHAELHAKMGPLTEAQIDQMACPIHPDVTVASLQALCLAK